MALIKPGPLVADISGSVGGVVFARNRGGLYARNRSGVTNPSTLRQAAVRGTLTNLSQSWANTLTQQQRDDWNAYGATQLSTNRLGEATALSGFACYCRTNMMRLDCGQSVLTIQPGVATEGPAVSIGGGVASATNVLTITGITGYSPTASPAGFLVRASRPISAGVSFFKGPFIKVLGQTLVTPVTFPILVTLPGNVLVGEKVFTACRLVTTDGRVGPITVQTFLST